MSDMKAQYYYSLSLNGFYLSGVSSVIPDDAIELSDEYYHALFAGQDAGKLITVNDDGMPILVDQPAPTKEQFIARAESKKTALMAEATVKIAPLEDIIEFDTPTVEEVNMLTALKKYRISLNRIDTSKAPDIDWPSTPE